MKLKINRYWWNDVGSSVCDSKIKPILGDNYDNLIKNRNNYEYSRIPIIHWIDEFESLYLLIKHTDIFEIYYEN